MGDGARQRVEVRFSGAFRAPGVRQSVSRGALTELMRGACTLVVSSGKTGPGITRLWQA